ncbi:MAG: hypothetical protein Q8P18_20895 [Pseudomonadota bacterium]|nr:hypothetical protein [Pseudomonadota bacterium]
MALLLFLACMSPPDPADPERVAPGDDSGAPGDTGPVGPEIPSPALTAAGVGSALSEALAWGLPTFPLLARTFSGLMAQGDAVCTPEPVAFQNLMAGGCRAASGVVFSGAGGGFGAWDDAGEVYSYQLRADFVITDVDGHPFEVGGDTQASVTVTDGALALSQELLGSFRYEPAGLWLGAGTSGAAWIEASVGDDGALVAQVDGGYDLGGAAVYFDQLAIGGACGTRPSGGMRLRDDSGYWYLFTYGAGCDTCGGVVYADGVSLGAACVDPTAAFATVGEDVSAFASELPSPPEAPPGAALGAGEAR